MGKAIQGVWWAFFVTIPNADRAVVDIRKLHDYCLNPMHDEGQHKAHLFATVVGMAASNAADLRAILLQAVKIYEAQIGRHDAYGQRYAVDFQLEWHGKRAIIRSGWIIEHGSDIPRLTTCYPLQS